ncbi:MAG: TIGR01906 family membrane protein [Chloroflexi bacterium]|nr:TIGR01906 family membrane protein [Chloroflexota bacterium]
MRTVGRLATALFLLAVPVFLVASNVRGEVNSLRLYRYGFQKYGVSQETGIPLEELSRAGRQIIAYFNSSQEPLDVRVRLDGQERSLYTPQEVMHMRDVKGLVQGVYRVQEIAGGYLLLYMLVGFLVLRRAFLRPLARQWLIGGLLTGGLILAAGVAVAVAFNWVFYLFHILSFRNSFWQLDPSRDYLIRMFPEGFWSDATVLLALATLAEALALAGVAGLVLRLTRGRVR